MVAPTESTLQKYYPNNVRTFLQGSDLSVIRQWQRGNSVELSVAMFNVIRDFNLASVIRNAEVFGLDHVHVIGWRKYDKRGTVGAHKLIDITHHKDFDSFVEHVGIGNIVPIEHPDQYDLTTYRYLCQNIFSARDIVSCSEKKGRVYLPNIWVDLQDTVISHSMEQPAH